VNGVGRIQYRREPIFDDDRGRQRFLDTLGQACEKSVWQVHAFCLMPNHFHLVLETPEASLVAGMKWFLGTYTSRHNRRHKQFGHLFSGRYKALPVDGSGTTSPGVYDLLVSAIVVQTSTAASIQKNGAGRMRLTANNSYTGNTAANAGTLLVDGSQPQSAAFVQSGSRLQGVGTVGPLFYNGFSSVVAPGDSPGILTCGNVSLLSGSGVLEIELNGTLPGIGYDQLNVHGTVNLSGVSLVATLNYASGVGDSFTIVNNDGTDAVLGTFVGLPQNATLYIGGELFQISYTGGTGNDVVLTRQVTPPKPALTLQLIPPLRCACCGRPTTRFLRSNSTPT
jgi:autotransporter-associated beta strand protein